MECSEADHQLPKILPSQLVLPEVTPATRLLDKRRQQHEADEALEAAKQQYASQESAFRKREEALKRRDLDLQDSLLRFTRFLQENDAKRAKANKRAADEARLRGEREAEIGQLLGEAAALRAQRESMQQELQKIAKYQHYLQSVVEAGDSFQEIADILARHATLHAANADLRQQQTTCSAEAERVREATAQHVKSRTAELLHLRNRQSLLKKELEASQAEAAALEAAQEYGLRQAADRQLELGQVVAATANIYQRCLQRSRVAHARDEASPLVQLQAIAQYLGDLREAIAVQQQQQQGQAAGRQAGGEVAAELVAA